MWATPLKECGFFLYFILGMGPFWLCFFVLALFGREFCVMVFDHHPPKSPQTTSSITEATRSNPKGVVSPHDFSGNHMGRSMVMGVPQNGWFMREILIKMDDLGVPPFMETPTWSSFSSPFTLLSLNATRLYQPWTCDIFQDFTVRCPPVFSCPCEQLQCVESWWYLYLTLQPVSSRINDITIIYDHHSFITRVSLYHSRSSLFRATSTYASFWTEWSGFLSSSQTWYIVGKTIRCKQW